MANTYNPSFVERFKKAFPHEKELHAALDKNDMGDKTQNLLSKLSDGVRIYHHEDERIVALFKSGNEREILNLAKRNIANGKQLRVIGEFRSYLPASIKT